MLRFGTLAIVLLLLLAACGGDDATATITSLGRQHPTLRRPRCESTSPAAAESTASPRRPPRGPPNTPPSMRKPRHRLRGRDSDNSSHRHASAADGNRHLRRGHLMSCGTSHALGPVYVTAT